MRHAMSVAGAVVLIVLCGPSPAVPGGTVSGAGRIGVFTDLPPKEAAALILNQGDGGELVVLDVRTPAEFREGRVGGAVLIDYYSKTFREQLARLDRGKTYLLYCRTGSRSGSAMAIMRNLGFDKVFNISGGFTRWKEEGLPTVK